MKYDFLVILLVAVSISLSLLVVISSQSLIDEPLTGQATTYTSGNVSLDISTHISIILNDSTINFGSCAINESTNHSLFDSNQSASWLDNSLCINGTFPDFMVLENDGTQVANITVKIINQTGAQLFNDSNAWFAFKTGNNSARPGCIGTLQSNYINFSLANTYYPLCSSIYYMDYEDQINLYMQAHVTNNSNGGGNVTVQFMASSI